MRPTFDILYRWRSLLLAAIIGALLEKRPERRILLAGTLPAEKKNVQLAAEVLKIGGAPVVGAVLI